MTLDKRLADAVHQVGDRLVVPEVDLVAVRSQARADRRRTVSMLVAAAVAAVAAAIVAAASLVGGLKLGAPAPAAPPNGVVAGAVPVWYDAAGLHRGNIVEATPVDLLPAGSNQPEHGLALVRGGALYRDPATDDVWFHPWGGQPEVVGEDVVAGPGGDPEGDLAAWFEGAELVVYDTAHGRESSRVVVAPVVRRSGYGHGVGDNGFVHVSGTEVVWRGTNGEPSVVHRIDVQTGRSSLLWPTEPGSARELADTHGSTRLWLEPVKGEQVPVVEIAGRQQLRLDGRGLVGLPSLSSDGQLLLSATGPYEVHGVAIADVRNGETWQLPVSGSYAWAAWSYGDVALVTVTRDGAMQPLLACVASTRTCEELPPQGGVLLPTH
jgi:hypothetical protein